MAGDEVRVHVRQQDVRDLQAVLVRELQVLIDVAPGIDDRGHTIRPDQVRGLGEAPEVDLLEDHAHGGILIGGASAIRPLDGA